MTTANETRRNVMLTAWTLRREGRHIRDGRTFGQGLSWAWIAVKRQAAAAIYATLRVVHFSPSLIRSPTQRALTGQRYAGARSYKAALTTARVGA